MNIRNFVREALFFGTFFLVVWLWVDPKLIFHGGGEFRIHLISTPGVAIQKDIPPVPGGAADYLAARAGQLDYFGWSGAIVATVAAWVLCRLADGLLARPGVQWLRALRFIPPALFQPVAGV